VQVGIDTKRLCKTSVALRDLTLVGAAWYKSSLTAGWTRGAAPTKDGLLNAPTRATNRNRCGARIGLWAYGRGVTRLRAGVLGWKTAVPELLRD
jgi:hypothetical protein